jgi:hypothetical protein
VPRRTLAGPWLPFYCSFHGVLVSSFMVLRPPPWTSCLDQAQPPFAISKKLGRVIGFEDDIQIHNLAQRHIAGNHGISLTYGFSFHLVAGIVIVW